MNGEVYFLIACYVDPTADVVALSPTTLMATNRFVCEICNKGFQRDQNLQLHRRGHNLPWKLRQRTSNEVKKRVYICPEPSCIHHNPARALGDLTGIKKHYSRKHGEKKWKCDKCSKKYAVQSDWKAHQKTCGTREYKCDCGTIFSRRDSFITHRAFCDALAEENNKVNLNQGLMNNNNGNNNIIPNGNNENHSSKMPLSTMNSNSSMESPDLINPLKMLPQDLIPIPFKPMNMVGGMGMFTSNSDTLFGNPRNNMNSSSSGLQLSPSNNSSGFNYCQENNQNNNGGQFSGAAAQMSATALLQKAAQMGASASSTMNSPMMQKGFVSGMAGHDQLMGNSRSMTNNQSFNNFQSNHQDQTTIMNENSGGENQEFNNPFLQKTQHEENNLGSGLHDIGLYSGMLMGNNDHHQNVTQKSPTSSLSVGTNSNSMLTLDLLGIGGSRSSNKLHVQHQRINFEEISRQRMQVMDPFQQQQPHGDPGFGKQSTIWDV
ncbi:non-receptor serine/threonine protein kinase [Lithospermum erythrorhizon]|uniref:Non-receptor serine/threonine protein kinase n=1 Tax=Lithospermum erythrorhizon TaxID=34254 RepID=A0AAV3P1C3_LITER